MADRITSVQAVDNDTWNRKLKEIIDRHPASNLLSIPGVYELVYEDTVNEVIAELMAELPNELEDEGA